MASAGPAYEFDEIDRNIIELLRRNGRATNQQVATRLGLAAATVSARIRRMEDASALRVVAVSDFAANGYNVLLEVAIEVEGCPAIRVAEDLAKIPEIFAVHLVTGRNDIDVLIALHNVEELAPLLFEKISKVKGIRNLTPAIAVDVVKYDFDVAPIT